MKLYRSMLKNDKNKPLKGSNSKTLSVRKEYDIKPVCNDYVYPKTGGTSVCIDSYYNIVPTLRPKDLVKDRMVQMIYIFFLLNHPYYPNLNCH